MNNEVLIQKAGINELTIINGLAHAIWPVTYKSILAPEQLDYMLEQFYSLSSLTEQFKKHSFLIAYINSEPVGFASYSLSTEAGIYKLHKIYVSTAIQGQGLGKKLINFILEEIKTSGAIALELNVNRQNNARLFYEKSGFVTVREEDIHIGNNYWMNDYVMRLNL